MAKTTVKQQSITAYIVSDVHLNSRSHDKLSVSKAHRLNHFDDFLTQIINTHQDQHEQCLLILNGDIFDINGSWFGPILPWDTDSHKAEKVLIETIQQILENNQSIVEKLGRLLAFNHVQVCYVIGNHDGLLNVFPAAKNFLLEALAPDEKSQNQLLFMNRFESTVLGLYAEHGHRFDRFNQTDSKNRFSVGDYITIMLINGFIEQVTERLVAEGFSQNVIDAVEQQIQDVEYLRPLSLIPLWIKSVAQTFRNHPENQEGKENLATIILNEAAETFDANTTRPLFEKLNLPHRWMNRILHWFVHLPGTLRWVSFLSSSIFLRTHSNRHQFQMAEQLHKTYGYRFIAFGHTHAPAVTPINEESYYFNTGSWQPVVNLFKHLDFDETNLETFSPFVRFNRIEHSGILKIEKDLTDPQSIPRFSLQTTRSSGSDRPAH